MNKFITIPTDLISDNNTTLKEKIILCEILNLSSLEKGCIASNNHFEELLGFSRKSVSNTINELKKRGILDVTISNRNNIRVISIIDEHTIELLSINRKKTVHEKSDYSKHKETINYVVELWNLFAEKYNKSKVIKVTKKRRDKIVKRINEVKCYEELFRKSLSMATQSDFCKHGNWFSFDWIIENDTNLIKVLEGKYTNRHEMEWE